MRRLKAVARRQSRHQSPTVQSPNQPLAMAGYGQPGYNYQLAPQYAGYGLPSVQTAVAGTEVNTAIATPAGLGFAGTGYAAEQYGSAPNANAGYLGYGYGQRIAAPRDIQAQYAGKPSFFDASRGILWDAQTGVAYYYAPVGSSVAGTIGAAPSRALSSANLVTAIEATPMGTKITLGNGTSGSISDHRNAISSFYLLDSPSQ